MCGISGVMVLDGSDAVATVLQSLKLQEYRGYDGAGIAGFATDPVTMHRLRCAGKTGISELGSLRMDGPLQKAAIAIGHTRWATKGMPDERNCHPHAGPTGRVMLVHNGTLTNEGELRQHHMGHVFESDTDSELLAHDLEARFEQDPLLSLIEAIKGWGGSFALIIMRLDDPDALWLVKHESPLMIGKTSAGFAIASSFAGLMNIAQEAWPLPESTIVRLGTDGQLQAWDFAGQSINGNDIIFSAYTGDDDDGSTGGLPHRTLREIFDQPRQWKMLANRSHSNELPDLSDARAIEFVACGTSLHAAEVCAQMFRTSNGVPVTCFEANEYEPSKIPGTVTIAISQSGETADVLAAMRLAIKAERRIGCLVNAKSSTLELLVHKHQGFIFYTHAGVEMAVASTKAFTCQVAALNLFALRRSYYCPSRVLMTVYASVNRWLDEQSLYPWSQPAKRFLNPGGSFFLGHGNLYPVAREGALKLMELAYVPAIAMPAGGMKHGPLALVQAGFPIAFLVRDDRDAPLLRNHIDQLKSRSGDGESIWVITDSANIANAYKDSIQVPNVVQDFSPLVFTLPLQFMAYHAAVDSKLDPDQPRNLAKSVTVR